MENKVGDNVPPQQVLDGLLTQLQVVLAELMKFWITLSDEERAARLKPLHGAEPMIAKAADLCQRYGVTVPGVPADGMLNDLRLAQQVRPFLTVLQSAALAASDTLGQAQSESWGAFLALYSALLTASAHNPALAGEVKELEEFMRAYGRKKRAPKAEPAKPTTGNAGG